SNPGVASVREIPAGVRLPGTWQRRGRGGTTRSTTARLGDEPPRGGGCPQDGPGTKSRRGGASGAPHRVVRGGRRGKTPPPTPAHLSAARRRPPGMAAERRLTCADGRTGPLVSAGPGFGLFAVSPISANITRWADLGVEHGRR